jgi:hypothetical protein
MMPIDSDIPPNDESSYMDGGGFDQYGAAGRGATADWDHSAGLAWAQNADDDTAMGFGQDNPPTYEQPIMPDGTMLDGAYEPMGDPLPGGPDIAFAAWASRQPVAYGPAFRPAYQDDVNQGYSSFHDSGMSTTSLDGDVAHGAATPSRSAGRKHRHSSRHTTGGHGSSHRPAGGSIVVPSESDLGGEEVEAYGNVDRPPTPPARIRNRQATRRSREKARRIETETTVRELELSTHRDHLISCVEGLRREVLDLRTEILRHSDCDCNRIQTYIARSASKVSQDMDVMPMPPLPPPPQHLTPHHPRRHEPRR